MNLADKLNEIVAVSQQRKIECTVGQLIDSLPEEDARALVSALNSPASTRSIYLALKTEGLIVDRSNLSSHRQGFCRCKENMND